MRTKRSKSAPPVGDTSFESIGGAAEVLDGLSHAGPAALLVPLLALVATVFAWFWRRSSP